MYIGLFFARLEGKRFFIPFIFSATVVVVIIVAAVVVVMVVVALVLAYQFVLSESSTRM